MVARGGGTEGGESEAEAEFPLIAEQTGPEATLPPSSARGSRLVDSQEVVNSWVGSSYRLPPGTTLRQAHFLVLLVEEYMELRRGSSLFELEVGIDHAGQLVVLFSATPEGTRFWETRLDEAFGDLWASSQTHVPAGLLRRARSRWRQGRATPAGIARAAAEAGLRGASPDQAANFALSRSAPPSLAELERVARGAVLVARLVYGTT